MKTVYGIEIECKCIHPNQHFPDLFTSRELAEKVIEELKQNTLGYFPSDFIEVTKPKFNVIELRVMESIDDLFSAALE